MRAFLRAIAMIVAAMAGSTPAAAALISYTGSNSGPAYIYDPATDYSPSTGYNPPASLGGYDGLIALPGFNTSLGTLDKVSLTTYVSGSLEFQQAYNIYGASTNTISASLYITGQTPYGGFGSQLPFVFTSGGHSLYEIFDTGSQNGSNGPSTYSNNLSSTFTPFYVNIFYTPVLAYADFQSYDTSYLGNATASYFFQETVTYDYTPALASVPESSTWTMLIIGFALVGSALRHQSKRSFVKLRLHQ